MRKIIAIVMIFIYTFVMVWEVPQRNAEANPAVLAAAFTPAGAAMLVAGGLTFATVEGAERAAKWWYSQAGQDARDAFMNDVNNAVNGVITLSDTAWISIKSFCQSNFVIGSNTVTAQIATDVNEEGYIPDIYYANDAGFPSVWTFTQFYMNGQLYTVAYANKMVSLYRGSYGAYHLFSPPQNADGFRVGYLYGSLCFQWRRADGTYKGEWVLGYTFPQTSPAITYPASLSYTGQEVLTNQSWEAKNTYGDRKIAIPASTSDLISKTYTDVIYNPVPTVPDAPINVRTGSVTDKSISLDWDLVPGADSYKVYVTGILYSVLAGTMTGLVIEGLQPSKTYTIGVEALNSVGVSERTNVQVTTSAAGETPITGDFAANGIDLTPLRVAGQLFTTKFPFSLPWDLLHSFTQLNGGNFNTKLEINVPDTNILKGMRFSVDFAQFESIVSVVKVIELLCFDIGLILLTRKLLGGGV